MSLRRQFLREIARTDLPRASEPTALIAERDLAPLPAAAQRYLRSMGVIGRPRDWSIRVGFTGRFRPRLDGVWMPCEAWQYSTRLGITRLFHMRLRFGGFLPVVGRDTYRDGHGRMSIKVLDLVPVEDASGREFDIGELVTYLNDAVLLAPSLLLGPEVTWAGAGEEAFDVTLTDHGVRVTARVSLDEAARPRDFRTEDRFRSVGSGSRRTLVRTSWSTPVRAWEMHAGRPLPASAQAVWHLPSGEDVPYADFRVIPESVAFNVAPGT